MTPAPAEDRVLAVALPEPLTGADVPATVERVDAVTAALRALATEAWTAVVVGPDTPDLDPLALLGAVRRCDPDCPVLLADPERAPTVARAAEAPLGRSGDPAAWPSLAERLAAALEAVGDRSTDDRPPLREWLAAAAEPTAVIEDGVVVAATGGVAGALGLPHGADPAGRSLVDLAAERDRESLTAWLASGPDPVWPEALTVALAPDGADQSDPDPVPGSELPGEDERPHVEVRALGAERPLLAGLRDVSELAATRRALEREAGVLDALLRAAPMSIYFKDREARHVRISDEMLEFLIEGGYTDDEGEPIRSHDDVVGLTDRELYSEAVNSYDDDLQVIETGDPLLEKEEISTSDHTDRHIRTTKVPWRDEHGEVRGLVGFTYGVTAEKRSDRLHEFATVVAHDVRNPLNVAIGALQLARADLSEAAPDSAGAARDADAQIERALDALDGIDDLLRNLHALSSEGRLVGELAPVALAEAVDDAWRRVDAQHAVELRTEALDGRTVAADRPRLEHLLENLLGNAVEHGFSSRRPAADDAVEHGAADDESLEITVGATEDGFYVADDGPGIPPHRRNYVFEEGYTSEPGGSGLGLRIVQRIVDAHGWSVDVGASEHGGARIDVTGVEDGDAAGEGDAAPMDGGDAPSDGDDGGDED